MKKKLLFLFLLISALAMAQKKPSSSKAVFKLPAGVTRKDYLPNTVIIKFKSEAAVKGPLFSGTEGAQSLKLQSAGISSIQKIFKDVPAGRSMSQSSVKENNAGLDRVFEFKFSGNTDVEKLINEILENSSVEYAEPRYIYYHQYVPNDVSFESRQAYLSQIHTPQAWDVIKNSSGVIIGIVDSGSDLEHVDLALNICHNPADPVNGVDDDHDGYIDNFRGWDFIGRSANNVQEDNNPDVTSDSTDHGVHVSGIASAVSDNSIGVASTAFNAKLLIVKVGADDNSRAIYRGYEGIKYAADHGAQIINCSWGGPGGGLFGQDIVNYAISKGCLIVAAAGNNNNDVPDFPSAYDGVMAVASVNPNDAKSGFSNFGSYVDVSAPGSGIYNTLNGNTYGFKSGTSMSTPMVSSVAALVKARFPSFSMLQVAEQIRVTCDNIDAVNPAYAGLMGRGRVNVLRAVTEIQPSVRYQKIALTDKGSGTFPAGDTINIFLDVKNFLAPAAGLNVKLSSADGNVRVINSAVNTGNVGTLETKNGLGPFRVLLKSGIPDNYRVDFRLDYSANGGSYTDFESFQVTVALDYQNVLVNKVSTSVTSNGRIGYSSPNADNGLGFVYKGDPLLYEASLMIGNSPARVSNNARRSSGLSDEHFKKRVRVYKVANPLAAFEGRSEFDDSNNPNLLNIYVKHRQLAYAQAPDDKYVIAEYEVQNKNTTSLSGMYVGLFTDWDVDQDGGDVTRYDPVNRMGYVFAKQGNSPYAAVKLLSTQAAPSYYPLSYQITGDPLESGGVFSVAEKFQTLSSGIKAQGLGESSQNGNDVMFVLGAGPYTIPANSSIKVAFAMIAGDNLGDIQSSAAAAAKKYQMLGVLEPLGPASAGFELKQNYPNPASGLTTLEFNLPHQGLTDIALFDVLGRRVRNILTADLAEGTYRMEMDVSELKTGIYFLKMQFDNNRKALAMQVAR